MTFGAQYAVNLFDRTVQRSLSSFEKPVIAMAGIGNPQRFFDMLQVKGVRLSEARSLADHHEFSATDIPPERKGCVLMTEKDAVKCRSIAHKNCWYIPVAAQLPESFLNQFIQRINQC